MCVHQDRCGGGVCVCVYTRTDGVGECVCVLYTRIDGVGESVCIPEQMRGGNVSMCVYQDIGGGECVCVSVCTPGQMEWWVCVCVCVCVCVYQDRLGG